MHEYKLEKKARVTLLLQKPTNGNGNGHPVVKAVFSIRDDEEDQESTATTENQPRRIKKK